MSPRTKKYLKRFALGLILSPILVVLLVMLLLYVPPLQRLVVKETASYLSRQTGMEISLESVHLKFPLDLSLAGLQIVKAPGDTLASVGALSLSPALRPLLDKQVEIPRIALERLRIHYTDSTGKTTLGAKLEQAGIEHLHVDLNQQLATLGRLITQGGDITYLSTDTTKSEKESEPLRWIIQAGTIDLQDTRLHVALPLDSLHIKADVSRLQLERAEARLEQMRFLVARGELAGRELSYAVDTTRSTRPYLDYQHLSLHDYQLAIEDLISEKIILNMKLRHAQLKEQSGLKLIHLSGNYQMDSLGMSLQDLDLTTDVSSMRGDAAMPWSLFQSDPTAPLTLQLKTTLGTKDLLLLGGDQLSQQAEGRALYHRLARNRLLSPLKLQLDLSGTLRELQLHQAELIWPELLTFKTQGSLRELLDSKRISGKLHLDGAFGKKANLLLSLLAPQYAKDYRIPTDLRLKGDVDIRRGKYETDLIARQGSGKVSLRGSYIDATKSYQVNLKVEALDVRQFLPKDSLGLLSLELQAHGRGFDIFSPSTQAEVHGKLHSASRGRMQLKDLTIDGQLKQGMMAVSLNSMTPGANFSLQLDGSLSRQNFTTGLGLDLIDLDLQRLGLSDTPLRAKLRLEGELHSDMKESHRLDAGIDGMEFALGDEQLAPPRADLKVTTTPETVIAHLTSHDLTANLSVASGPTALQQLVTRLTEETLAQVKLITAGKSATKHLEDLTPYLPSAQLQLQVGRENPLRYYLARQRIALGSLEGKLTTSPQEGISGSIALSDLRVDTLRINLAQLNLSTERTTIARGDSLSLVLFASVMKSRFRQQEGFTISTDLRTSLQQGHLDFSWQDERGTLQHAIELEGIWSGEAYRLHLLGDQLRIAYNDFKINPDNQLSLRKRDNFLLGALRLQGERRGELSLLAEELSPGQQDLTLSIKNLHLEDYRSLGLPDVGGTLFGDVHYQRQGDLSQQPTISGDLSLSDLRYEDKKFGLFSASLFYEPRSNDSHYITANLGYNGQSAMALDGIYYPKEKVSPLKGSLELTGFPLELANPFLVANGTALQGQAYGQISLAGKLTKPQLTGQIQLEKALVDLATYGTHLRLDTIPVRLEGSNIYFDHYAVRPSSDAQHAIYLDGMIREATSPQATASLRITSDELVLLDEPRPTLENQLLYGKIIASTNMNVSGPMTGLRVRGGLNILSGTNCTYILREDPLSAKQAQSQLVEFVDFADTVFAKAPEVETASLGGLDVNLTIHVDPSVRLGADLTTDGADYVDARGGGTLHFTYPPYGEMSLTGHYEMSGGGELSYTLPVVGNKRFTINPTSMLIWRGPISNPYLNFSAVNKVKANVTTSSGSTERVNFNVNIGIKDYVRRMSLSFTLAAPENLTMQNALSTMTAEEQSKQAIALMATGMYLGSGAGASNLNLNAALTSLLQSQINKTAGKLLQGTDLNIGMDRYDGSNGTAAHTDYTYSFSRRFYNDRIRIIVGGKVQSGDGAKNQAQTFLDNVSLQYQLDRTGEQYLSLYHKLVTDNILEGEFTETGVGYVLRRKVNSLLDLFKRRRKVTAPAPSSILRRELWTPMQDSAKLLPADSAPLVRPSSK